MGVPRDDEGEEGRENSSSSSIVLKAAECLEASPSDLSSAERPAAGTVLPEAFVAAAAVAAKRGESVCCCIAS